MAVFEYISQHYPVNPGCYLMKNEAGRVLYVGKAKNLRRRLGQYFQAAHQVGKAAALVAETRAIEVIVVSSELESLILENNLIKLYKPRYNVLLVPDSSGYGYVVQTDEVYPRLVAYKKHRINPALGRAHPKAIERRFGPYLTNKIRDEVLKCVVELCGLRVCNPMPQRVCYLFHLKRCLGPCERYVTHEEYLEAVEKAGRYLAAPHLNLVDHLTERMKAAAEALEFERAKHIRDQIETIKVIFERQAVERDVPRDQDVVYLDPPDALILHLKRGTLLTVEWLPGALRERPPDAFLLDHYRAAAPQELILRALADPAALAAGLSAAHGRAIKVTLPVRGALRDLVDIARLNFEYRREVAEKIGG